MVSLLWSRRCGLAAVVSPLWFSAVVSCCGLPAVVSRRGLPFCFSVVVFPLLSPNPATDSNIHFGKYQLHVGGNRGRGQVYPTGEKSNNTVYTAPASGSIAAIEDGDNGSSILTINTTDGDAVTETIPVGPQLLVNVGDSVEAGSALTNDPNVGGFGQVDAEIVLQNPVRIYGLLAFFAAVAIAQIMLVLKKKQVEKVQAAEGNF